MDDVVEMLVVAADVSAAVDPHLRAAMARIMQHARHVMGCPRWSYPLRRPLLRIHSEFCGQCAFSLTPPYVASV